MVKSVGVYLAAILAVLGLTSLLLNRSVRLGPPAAEAAASQLSDGKTGVVASDSPLPSGAYVARGADGHYWAWAELDNHPVRVLVDTGASDVALTAEDARKIGVDPDRLTYDRPMATALGVTYAASVTLDTVSVSGARIDHVQAMVVPKGLATSLLGMSYLARLNRFEADANGMILRP